MSEVTAVADSLKGQLLGFVGNNLPPVHNALKEQIALEETRLRSLDISTLSCFREADELHYALRLDYMATQLRQGTITDDSVRRALEAGRSPAPNHDEDEEED